MEYFTLVQFGFVLSFAHFPPYGLEFFREGPKKKMQMPGECQTVALALEVFSWHLIKMQRLRFDGHKCHWELQSMGVAHVIILDPGICGSFVLLNEQLYSGCGLGTLSIYLYIYLSILSPTAWLPCLLLFADQLTYQIFNYRMFYLKIYSFAVCLYMCLYAFYELLLVCNNLANKSSTNLT